MNHTLVIHSVKTRDGGVYRCQAYNTRGSIEAPATLNVIGNMADLISLFHCFDIFFNLRGNVAVLYFSIKHLDQLMRFWYLSHFTKIIEPRHGTVWRQ